MKFTQGPWGITKICPRHYMVTNKSNDEICMITESFENDGKTKANARLLSKAPELYALLAEIIGEQDFWPTDKDNSIYECRWCGRIYDNVNGPHALCSSDDCLGNRARQALKEVKGEHCD